MREIEYLNKAYETYNLDSRYDISNRILEYIRKRIEVNQDYIDRIIMYQNQNYSFEDLLKVFDEYAITEDLYKVQNQLEIVDNIFISGKYLTSVGNILVETTNPLIVLAYYILGIKTRNTITISDLDYEEVNLKSMLTVIFCEALSKFNLDRNLLMIMPYEECNYEDYDVVIYADDNNRISRRDREEVFYIYKHSSNFEEKIAEQVDYISSLGKKCVVLEGEFYDVISRINKTYALCSIIYTEDFETGYKFINLVHSSNVFMNGGFEYFEFQPNKSEILLITKKIVYTNTVKPDDVINKRKTEDVSEEKKEVKKENKTVEDITSDKDLINEELNIKDNNVNPWYIRIIEAIKRFFKKIFNL